MYVCTLKWVSTVHSILKTTVHDLNDVFGFIRCTFVWIQIKCLCTLSSFVEKILLELCLFLFLLYLDTLHHNNCVYVLHLKWNV